MNALRRLIDAASRMLACATPLADLVARLMIAEVFWKAGVNKFQSWESTLMLFEYEYAVPLLPPELAAWIAAATELSLPVLLALGLGGRFAALGLFVFNIVAVVSYPDMSDSGRQFHVLWGIVLALLMTHGPGGWSLDALIRRKWGSRSARPEGV